MVKKSQGAGRREESLSRDQIIEASIELLDRIGESGLTFRALAQKLATGAGAIYWHIDDKNDLLTAACDAVIARTVNAPIVGATPDAIIRALALNLFDAIDAHPWVGSALIQSPGQMPMVRILERIGQQIRALGVPEAEQFAAASAVQNYILGVGAQNAANGQLARARGFDRTKLMDAVSTAWLELDADEYPFAQSVVAQLRTHDDRVDFLVGIDLILLGLNTARNH